MTESHRSWRVAFWAWWIRAWLRTYPRRFRESLGHDLARQYLDQPPPRGLEFVRAMLGAARDLGAAGIGAHLDDGRGWIGGLAGLRPGRGAWHDVRHGVRSAVRQPSVSAAVVGTIAVAVGLAAAVFAIFDATLVRALPYPGADRVVSVGSRWLDAEHSHVSIPEYLDYQSRAHSFESLAAYYSSDVNFTDGPTGPERVASAHVTASFFDVLAVGMPHGRVFSVDEDRPGAEDVAVISDALWYRRFGGDPGVLGSTIRLEGRPVTIVGIAPTSLRFPLRETDVWLPLRVNAAQPGGRGAHTRQVIARLRRVVSLDAAQVEMARIAAELGLEHPRNYPAGSGWSVSVLSLRDLLVGDARAPLRMLMAAVLCVMLVAAANVAGLLLARAVERRTEFAMRAALGASSWRLLRQTVIEGAVLGLAGALAALPISAWLVAAVESVLPPAVVRPASVLMDLRVVAFIIVAASLGTAAAALVASISGRIWSTATPTGSRVTVGRPARRARSALVVGEIALASFLLVGAGLAVTSFMRLAAVDPGLSIDRVTTGRVSARVTDDDAVMRFFADLFAALDAKPGVIASGAVSLLPLSGDIEDYNFGVEGYVRDASGLGPNAQTRTVGGRYFEAMGIPVKEGRAFENRDASGGEPVAIVSEALARQYWPEGRALGRRIKVWGPEAPGQPWRTVIGIVGDVRHRGLSQPETPILYLPLAQWPQARLTIVVRGATEAPPPGLIREAVWSVDPAQPVFELRDMATWRQSSMGVDRFTMLLVSAFGSTALAVSALGIYSVLSLIVAGRTREFGVRLALGARASTLVRLTIRDGVLFAIAGLGIGLPAAVLTEPSVSSLLYDIRPIEPLVLAAVAVLLGVVAVVACVVPARRAGRVDPVTTLRAG